MQEPWTYNAFSFYAKTMWKIWIEKINVHNDIHELKDICYLNDKKFIGDK